MDAVGRFNEKRLSGGDLEWGQKVHAHGYTLLYRPNVLIYHPARKTKQELLKKTNRVVKGLREHSNYRLTVNNFSPPFTYWRQIVQSPHVTGFEQTAKAMYVALYKKYYVLYQLLKN